VGEPGQNRVPDCERTRYHRHTRFREVGAGAGANVQHYLEACIKQFNLVSETKDYRELFAAQAKLASECNEKALNSAKKATEILNEARSELTSWFERGVTSAVANLRIAVEAFTRKAA